jgi:hypothetical protein
MTARPVQQRLEGQIFTSRLKRSISFVDLGPVEQHDLLHHPGRIGTQQTGDCRREVTALDDETK